MLTCSSAEKIQENIDNIQTAWCYNKKNFIELVAAPIFDFEIENFDKTTVNKIMLNDIDNPNWLAQKGIYNLREHKLCLETVCDLLEKKCSNKNYKDYNDQKTWCKKTANTVFKVQKAKIKSAVLENQRRKTRTAWREKFRGIEVRMNRYFIPNLIDFGKEFERFTNKITAFVLNPL
jgi:hypothetical protein